MVDSHAPRSSRPATAAGRFYPHRRADLQEMVSQLLLPATDQPRKAPKAVISPHAGYAFSGPIAASALSRFAPDAEHIRRVVLVGPSHFVSFMGLAVPRAQAFETPLGTVTVDQRAIDHLLQLSKVSLRDDAHSTEHCLEVQLPFLQIVLKEFSIVPVTVGEADEQLVAQALEVVWGGTETRLVVSSDLSHYFDPQTARRLDEGTARAIERLESEAVFPDRACGCQAIRGLLHAARIHHLHARRLDLRNSGDTAGPCESVVGYGAFAFYEN